MTTPAQPKTQAEQDVLVAGDGFAARLLVRVLRHLRLRAARVSLGRAWEPRTVALPGSTIAELQFLGIERAALAEFLVPEARRPASRPEPLWLVSEGTLLALAGGDDGACPGVCERVEAGAPPVVVTREPAERWSAGLVVIAGHDAAPPPTWIETSRLQITSARFAAPARRDFPAHVFAHEGDRWVWGVEEQGAGTLLVTEAAAATTTAAAGGGGGGGGGAPPPDPDRLAARACALGMPAAGAAQVHSFDLSIGVDATAAGAGVLRAGAAIATLDPITSLGLRGVARGAIRCALACRALLEQRLPPERVERWYRRGTVLEAAFLQAESGWQYEPPVPGQILPPWTARLPNEVRQALERKLLIPVLMRQHQFLEAHLVATPSPPLHPGLREQGPRLAPVQQRGCPILGLTTEELASSQPLLDSLATPTTPAELLAKHRPAHVQELVIPLIRLLEAGLVERVAAG